MSSFQDGSSLDAPLKSIEQTKQSLTSQYNLAESTRLFWERCSKSISVFAAILLSVTLLLEIEACIAFGFSWP